jgi:SHS2 domain-containing protein
MSRSAALPQAGWEHFPHDADVGVRGWGATAAQALEQAAHALTAVITHAEVEPQVRIECGARRPTSNSCWSNGSNAIIYEMAVRNMLLDALPCGSKTDVSKARMWASRRCRTPCPGLRAQGGNLYRRCGLPRTGTVWSAACIVDV